MIASPLAKRIVTAIALLIPSVAIILYGGLPLILLSLACFLIINYEFFAFATPFRTNTLIQHVLLMLLLPMGYFFYGLPGIAVGVSIASMLLFVLMILAIESESHEPDYSRILPALFVGLGYTGVLGTLLVVVASQVEGRYLLWLLLSVIGADTIAYFGGRFFGGRKLAPRISPNKTVSGGVCGLLGAVLGSALGVVLFSLPIPPVTQVGFGVLIGVFAVFGDLAESLVKRVYQVKDSGTLLPGHGGVLDRIDALLFAAPLLFFL